MMRILTAFVLSLFSHAVTGASWQNAAQLGQKIMLDIRYFCESGTSEQCREPVTQFPPALGRLIADYQIGGVVLFAENIASSSQLRQLTQALQQHSHEPLMIAVDQEGGRVARLPTTVLPAFSGNMALGATYALHGTALASEVATIQAQSLLAHGINVNFAPVVDVNNNPANPVINVRAFGSEPEQVAKFGAAMVDAYQAQGLLATLKHFPGHGDTEIDSHTGLPRVNHSRAQIDAQDLAPFKQIIEQHSPALVMTAHIQYPALDNTRIVGKSGESIIAPATLSRVILEDVLRKQLGFDGLIVTDALDMAGITHFFTRLDALTHTFRAGADIALMPFTIRTPEDIEAFGEFFASAMDALQADMLSEPWQVSLQRIAMAKQALQDEQPLTAPRVASINTSALSAQLARASSTYLTPVTRAPLHSKMQVAAIMPDELRCRGLAQAMQAAANASVTCMSMATQSELNAIQTTLATLNDFDRIIIGELSPIVSAVEMGGMDDVAAIRARRAKRTSIAAQQQLISDMLSQPGLQKKAILVALRAPYFVMSQEAPVKVALYDYRVTQNIDKTYHSYALQALVQGLLNPEKVTGTLPVD